MVLYEHNDKLSKLTFKACVFVCVRACQSMRVCVPINQRVGVWGMGGGALSTVNISVWYDYSETREGIPFNDFLMGQNLPRAYHDAISGDVLVTPTLARENTS